MCRTDKNLGPALIDCTQYIKVALNDHLLHECTYLQLSHPMQKMKCVRHQMPFLLGWPNTNKYYQTMNTPMSPRPTDCSMTKEKLHFLTFISLKKSTNAQCLPGQLCQSVEAFSMASDAGLTISFNPMDNPSLHSSKAWSITLPGSADYKKNTPSHPWPSSPPAMQSVWTPTSQLVLPSVNFSTSPHTSSKLSPSSCKTTFSSSQTHTGNSCPGLPWALPPHACGQHCSSTLMKNFCAPPTPSQFLLNWAHYINNGIGVQNWTGTPECIAAFKSFLECLQLHHLRWEINQPTTCINYLDIMLSIKDGWVSSTLFEKIYTSTSIFPMPLHTHQANSRASLQKSYYASYASQATHKSANTTMYSISTSAYWLAGTPTHTCCPSFRDISHSIHWHPVLPLSLLPQHHLPHLATNIMTLISSICHSTC